MNPGIRGHATVAALMALVASGPSRPVPAAEGPSLLLKDRPCGDPAFAACDALEVRMTPEGGAVRFEVTLGAPPDPRLLTRVMVWVDGDRNRKTGTGGDEPWFRAAVGSAFGGAGTLPGRLSWSSPSTRETIATGRTVSNWTNHYLEGGPEVEGSVLRFTIPAKVMTEAVSPTSDGFDVSVAVDAWVGDRPLLVEATGADEGLPVLLDGDAREWTGEPEDLDAGAEMFPPLAHLDLRRLRVDQGPKDLFVCVDTDRSGFGVPPAPSPDLVVRESITLLAEPVEAAYEKPHRLVVPRGQDRGATAEGAWAVRGRTLEARIPRTGLDGRIRVLAWSEGSRRDWIPDRGYARFGGGGR